MTKTLTKAVLLAASIIKFLEAEAETMSESDKKEGLKGVSWLGSGYFSFQ